VGRMPILSPTDPVSCRGMTGLVTEGRSEGPALLMMKVGMDKEVMWPH
jgi:hypothetical protein